MLTHTERLTTAAAAVDYIAQRSTERPEQAVPNCPGWTIYNVIAHIGRVAIAWSEMISAPPDDPESRARGYRRSAELPAGTPVAELADAGHRTLALLTDPDRRCYFSMTGGEGTTGLWAWHAAAELGVHRLDVEAALGNAHALTDAAALDAADYTCRYFLPAMRRATSTDPGRLTARLLDDDGRLVATAAVDSDTVSDVVIEGPATQVVLALWGRPNVGVEAAEGDPAVWRAWRELPGMAFQFGTWD